MTNRAVSRLGSIKLNTSEYTKPSALPLKLFTSVLQSSTPFSQMPSLQTPPVWSKNIWRPMDSQLVSSLSTRCVLLMFPNMNTENTSAIPAKAQMLLPEGLKLFQPRATTGKLTTMPTTSKMKVERME